MFGRERIDYTTIVFPTDALTLGDIRRSLLPDIVRGEWPISASLTDVKGIEEAWIEQTLAAEAFRDELGVPPELCDEDREAHVERLNDLYLRMGWSSGMHQTKEIVRRFTDAARQQVRTAKGKPR